MDHVLSHAVAATQGPLDSSSPFRRRPLFWLALAFALGIWLDDFFQPGLQTLGSCWITAALVAVAALVFLPNDRVCAPGAGWLSRGRASFAVALWAGLAGGALDHACAARLPGPRDVTIRTPPSTALAWVEGTVVDVQLGTPERGPRWTFELVALGPAPEELTPATGRVLLNTRVAAGEAASISVAQGDRLRLLARLEAPEGATLPESFDYAAYLARQGIRRVGEAAAQSAIRLGCAGWWRIDLWLRRWGSELAARNTARLGGARAALLNALLLGSREGLDDSDRDAFARAGTAHLLAISGLHFQAAAALVWWLLARLGCSRRRAGIAILAFVSAYALFVGANPPVVRSALAIVLYVGAILLRRPPDPLTVLGAAALALLMVTPGDLFLAGFQLTFLAVLALVTLYPALEAGWHAWRGLPEEWIVDERERAKLKWTRAIRRTLFISFVAWVGTAPAVAWHMGYFTWFSIGINVFAVPLSMVAMACGGISMLPGTAALHGVLAAPLDLLLGLNRVVGGWPAVSLDVPPPPAALCAAYAALAFTVWRVRGPVARWPRQTLLLGAALLSLAAVRCFRPPPQASRLTVLDLPRGRAALLETPSGEAALIDAGPGGQGRRIADSLRRRGLRVLALLVITEDTPAALGGAPEILEGLRVQRAVLPRSGAPSAELRALEQDLERLGIPYAAPDFAASLRGPGDIRWDFATDAPPSGPPRAGSEALSVRVTLAGSAVLLASARSNEGLRRLLAAYGDRLPAAVLRLAPGPGERWPVETAQLIARSGAKVIIAGADREGAGEGAGLDLSAWTQARGLRLLALHREGSLRVGEERMALSGRLEAFRAGRWQELPPP